MIDDEAIQPETREKREERLEREYAAYLEECKQSEHPPINYMNWAAGRKQIEQWD